MPFDISGIQLRDLTPEERVDFSKSYEVAGEYQAPPEEGQYLFQTTALKAAKHKEGILAADLTAVVADVASNTQGKGYKVYENGGIFNIKRSKFRNASNVDDYLRSHGIAFDPGSTPTNAEYAQALGLTEGRFFPATIVWEGYCKDCDSTIKGMDQFPKNADGTRSYRRPCATCKKEVFARGKFKRYISTVPGDQK